MQGIGAFMKIVHSVAFFRHEASAYESERCGVARGIFFNNYIAPLILAHREVWKGCELRVHHDERVKELASWPLLVEAAKGGDVKLVPCGEAPTLCGGMLWRLRPLYEEGAEWVVCRDVDALPMHRDRKMVEEAIASGAVCHAVLDSESHSGLMGGMVAFHAPTFRSIVPRLPEFETPEFNQHGSDQRWLNSVIWPAVVDRTFIHQRRADIAYPQAMRTARVAPKETPLDNCANHLGGCFDVERALVVLRAI